ncbi:MAG: Sensor histidine kinase RcsC [Verrucomicrobiae bacterium]|nr:Sensor histidine kinase RcsC [Verrucomicrobiae bacterium]
MNGRDDEFLKSLLAAFRGEAAEHWQAISAGLLELERSPAPEVVERVYREAHSLKGAARAVSQTEIETVCQALESAFAGWKRQEWQPVPASFDTLHRATDLIQQLVEAPGSIDPGRVTQMKSDIETLCLLAPRAPAPEHVEPVMPATHGGETIRVATRKLDGLMLQAEEMLAVKLAVNQRAGDLRELRTQFNEQLRAEAPDPHQLRVLEAKLQTLSRVAEHDNHTIGRMVDDLLEGSKQLLMLPCATFLNVLPKLVRDLCRDQAKEAELVVHGGEVEIDKRILEEMKDPLIHLVRNCVDHGVEKPAERARLGKPARATITVSVTQVDGNKVELAVSDDGAGVAVEHVKAAAVKHGLVSAADARQLDEPAALALMFLSGVSTTPIITKISGRGLGLAIVREKAENLGGRVAVQTQAGKGTTFRILLPLTLATFRGTLVQAAGQTFVIPTTNVERVGRVRVAEIKTVENNETIAMDGKTVALVRLAPVLELPANSALTDEPVWLTFVVVTAGEKRIAFGVEAVLRAQEVLVKSLRKPLVRVRNIAGATVLGSGAVVLILNVADLLQSATKVRLVVKGAPARAVERKVVLVVEDSITSRMLLKNILESAGYRVRTAVDGLDALSQLKTEPVDGVVSDVQMPRLDGFNLTEKIRADRKLAELPVVLVTALGTQEDRERGVEVGANAYIVKSSFDQSNLLEALRRLV